MKDLESLIKMINNYPSDIRAEVIMADLIQEGYLPSDFLIIFDSSFKRRYSNDVLKAERYPINKIHDVLGVYLARDGLYDILPEGLFHATSDSAMNSGGGMAVDSKKESRIEAETRKFFLPFENEFFYQRVQLELHERAILEKLSESDMDDFSMNFWKIDRNLPRKLAIKLCTMLPFAKSIIGDFEMTAGCLGAILGETVSYSIQYSSKSFTESILDKKDGTKCTLGKTILGIDMINNGKSYENCKILKFNIGPLQKTGIEPYLKDGEISNFINYFSGFFLPLEMDYEFEIIIQKDNKHFILDPIGYGSLLGYSAVI